jgi:dTDP-4-dehydrorhamnose 3,5-epimerase
MNVTSFEIDGPKLISMPMYRDERGFFVERFRKDRFSEFDLGLENGADAFVQDNFSRSLPGVVRGLHAQFDRPQGKLVTCVRGRIFDVAVDLRAGSPTFGRSVSAILSGDEPRWIWIPAGFAHGFSVMGDEAADVTYKVTASYNPIGECGIVWNDAELAVPWPLDRPPVISEKDRKLPSFAAYKSSPHF